MTDCCIQRIRGITKFCCPDDICTRPRSSKVADCNLGRPGTSSSATQISRVNGFRLFLSCSHYCVSYLHNNTSDFVHMMTICYDTGDNFYTYSSGYREEQNTAKYTRFNDTPRFGLQLDCFMTTWMNRGLHALKCTISPTVWRHNRNIFTDIAVKNSFCLEVFETEHKIIIKLLSSKFTCIDEVLVCHTWVVHVMDSRSKQCR